MASVKVVRLLSQLATKELVSQVAQVPKEVTQVQRRIFLRRENIDLTCYVNEPSLSFTVLGEGHCWKVLIGLGLRALLTSPPAIHD